MSNVPARRAYQLKGRSGLFVEVTDEVPAKDAASADAENELVGYLLTPAEYERVMSVYEDHELNALADARQGQERVRVAFDDL